MTPMNNLFPSFGLGEVDLLQDPVITDQATGTQFYVEPGAEPFNITLLAGAESKDLSQFFQKDSDFLWTGVCGNSTGAYQVQFTMPDGKLMSSAPIQSVNIIGTAQFPVPIWPAVKVPAGGKIGINEIKDLSAAGNTIQIVFLGVRLYRVR